MKDATLGLITSIGMTAVGLTVVINVALSWNGQPYLIDVADAVDQLAIRITELESQVGLPNLPGGNIEDNISDMLDYLGDVHVEIQPTSPTSAWVNIMSHINMSYHEHLNISIILASQLGRDIRIDDTRYTTGSHFVVHVINIEPGRL